MSYFDKYLKYKNKYLKAKKLLLNEALIGGSEVKVSDLNPVYRTILTENFGKLYGEADRITNGITDTNPTKRFHSNVTSSDIVLINNFMTLVKELKQKIDRNTDIRSSLEKIKSYRPESLSFLDKYNIGYEIHFTRLINFFKDYIDLISGTNKKLLFNYYFSEIQKLTTDLSKKNFTITGLYPLIPRIDFLSNYVKGPTVKPTQPTDDTDDTDRENYRRYEDYISYITNLELESLKLQFSSLPNYSDSDSDNKEQINTLLEYIMKIREIILEFDTKTTVTV